MLFYLRNFRGLQVYKILKCLLSVCSIPGEKPNKDPYRLKKKYSTKLEDLDYLPLDFCRQHLRVRSNAELVLELINCHWDPLWEEWAVFFVIVNWLLMVSCLNWLPVALSVGWWNLSGTLFQTLQCILIKIKMCPQECLWTEPVNPLP